MSQPDISNLRNCVEDALNAALDQDPGPPNPTQYSDLRGRLVSARPKMPKLYIDAVYTPFVAKLDELGEAGFQQIMLNDANAATMMMDIAQAILQRGEGYESKAVAAFQEVISDLYDGFLSAEDRTGVEPPDRSIIPPLVKFGNPEDGPYTWPVDATQSFGLKTGIVNLPPVNARRGLFSWPALGHECCGHDILHADTGLLGEVAQAVRSALSQDSSTKGLAAYWADRIDETASDVMGILNLGPAAAIGLVGYFRGLNGAFSGSQKLRNDGPSTDPHPADIVRGFLAAAVVRKLEFSGAAAWATAIEAEVQKDVSTIHLAGKTVAANVAKHSAELVAAAIMSHPMQALENHSLDQIQNWTDQDEQIVQTVQAILSTPSSLPPDADGTYAAHVVAAATMSALQVGANIPNLFSRMLDLLRILHQRNPAFGPLAVRHPGNLHRDRVYIPSRELVAVGAEPSSKKR